MDKHLYIKVWNGEGVDSTPFPSAQNPARLDEFQFESARMGVAPEIRAELMWPTCLDDEWTDNVFVEFEGEKYFLYHRPSSEKNNDDERWHHSILFRSERSLLAGIYVYDAVEGDDSPASNNTTVRYSGQLDGFIQKLNASLNVSELGSRFIVVIDDGIETDDKTLTFEDKYFNEALSDAVETWGIPYYIFNSETSGKTEIHFGYYKTEIGDAQHPLTYRTEGLTMTKKEHSGNDVINRATGYGSSENLPWYYPNESDTGSHKLGGILNVPGQTKVDYNALSRNFENFAANNETLCWYKGYPYKVRPSFCEIFFRDTDVSKTYYDVPVRAIYAHWPEYVDNEQQGIPGYYSIFKQNESSIVNEGFTSLQYGRLYDAYATVGFIFFLEAGQSIHMEPDIKLNLNSVNLNVDSAAASRYTKVVKISGSSVNIQTQIENYMLNRGHISHLDGHRNNAEIDNEFVFTMLQDGQGTDLTEDDGRFEFTASENGLYLFEFRRRFPIPNSVPTSRQNAASFTFGLNRDLYFDIDAPHFRRETEDTGHEMIYQDKGYILGIKDNPADGDSLTISKTNWDAWMTPQPNLMPEIYRLSILDKVVNPGHPVRRFYNAKNYPFTPSAGYVPDVIAGEYIDENDGKVYNRYYFNEEGDPYLFGFPFNEKKPVEHISRYDEIKASITGIENSDHQPIDEFLDIAYDEHDNNRFIEDKDGGSETMEHPYFYVKLPKMPFNLFSCVGTEPAIISMTSGICAACKFQIMVEKDSNKNTVQVDEFGELKRDENGNVIFGTPQDEQQNTQIYEVWIALQKDISTYGSAQPRPFAGQQTEEGIKPEVGDKYVITGIWMPFEYILEAERRLSQQIVADVYNNNFHRFNTGIDFSRIYLEENPEKLSKLCDSAKIWVKHNNTDPAVGLYVSSFRYSMTTDALPEITVELADSLIPELSSIQLLESRVTKTVLNMSAPSGKPITSAAISSSEEEPVILETSKGRSSLDRTRLLNNLGLKPKGNSNRPIYLDEETKPKEVDGLDVPESIRTQKNVEAMWGVSAFGIANMAISGTGGQGDVTSIQFDPNQQYREDTPYTANNGLVKLPAYPDISGKADKSETVTAVTWDNINKKLTKTIYGITTDIVTAASILDNLTANQVNIALGYTPFDNADFTKANIKSTLEISDWALAASKPSYAFSEITGTASDSQIPTLAISKISGLQTALDSKLATSLKGAANGLAELDANGLVPSSQLPSYVDDVLEYASKSAFPATGETGKIYVALDTNLTYRWSGSAYVEISPSLALGETSSTAYRGDRGKTAYDHATDTSRLTTAQSSGFYKFATTAEGHIASVTAVGWSDITALDDGSTYAAYGHTHATSIATSTDTNQLTLGFGSKYALTAGGTSYIFTMPTNPVSALDYADPNYASGKYVSKVTQTDGLIDVTHESFATPAVTWAAGTTEGPTLKITTDGGDSTAVAIPAANGTANSEASGIVTTGAQTFAGLKTFNGSVNVPKGSYYYKIGELNILQINSGNNTIFNYGTIGATGFSNSAVLYYANAGHSWYLGTNEYLTLVSSAFRPSRANINLGGNATNNRWATIYGVNGNFSDTMVVTNDIQSSNGNIEALHGGVSAMGIANMAINSGGGQGTLTQIKVNGTALSDVNGVVNIPLAVAGTNGRDGAMSNADKTKLDGIETNANNYVLPAATANALGGIKVGTKLSIDSNGVLSATDTTYAFASGDNNGQIKVTPSGGSAQNIDVTGLDTAAFHAHDDYVTGMSWDSTNSKLAWSKGGSDQTAISIGYATNSGAVYNATLISSSSALDSFHEANKMKYGVWNTFNTSILNSNGIVIDVGYTSATYGAQILIDDDPTYIIGLRQRGANGWSDWKRIPMGDGTGASGTWNINVSGSAGSVAWANVTDHPTSLSQFTDDLGSSPTHTHSQYLTGNQTITLSGDVSGSGTTAITTSIGTGKVTNAMLAGSITNAKLSSLGKFTIGSTAIELGTTYTAANFRSYLGLGGAATYGATSSVTDGGTSLVTSGGVYSYVNALLTAAMKIEGETTTEISDGSTTNPVVIGGQSVSAYKGMVVFYGSKEFVWVGTAWKELGDESSFALKTTTVSGTGYLTGGGALSSNQTIDIASSVKTNIDNGATAYGWGNHASAGYVKAATDDTISGLKTFSHGIFVQGRVYNSGDDEGIVIKKANNGYAGVTLIKTTISGIRTTLYLDASDKARWTYNNGTTNYSIYHPEKNGTIALTTDIPTKLSDLTDDLGSSPTHTHSQYLPLTGGTLDAQSTYPFVLDNTASGAVDTGMLYKVGSTIKGLVITSQTRGMAIVNVTASYHGLGVLDNGTPYYGNGSTNYTLLHSGNYSNYALPLSGGTITGTNIGGPLIINTTGNATEVGIPFKRNGTVKAWVGYHDSLGVYLYNSARNKYLNYTDNGVLMFEANKVWHEGNDGANSGLDADLLDGYHENSFYSGYLHTPFEVSKCVDHDSQCRWHKAIGISLSPMPYGGLSIRGEIWYEPSDNKNVEIRKYPFCIAFNVNSNTDNGPIIYLTRACKELNIANIRVIRTEAYKYEVHIQPHPSSRYNDMYLVYQVQRNSTSQVYTNYNPSTLEIGTATDTWGKSEAQILTEDVANYAYTAGSAPASDVYAWAKEATKPSYNFGEIGAGNATIGDGANRINLRTQANWASAIYHNTDLDEAVVFLAQAKNNNSIANYTTSWIFAYGNPTNRPSWTGLTPALQIKGESVIINKLIGSKQGSAYNLDVNGTIGLSGQLTSTVADGTAPMVITSKTRVANLNADLLDGYNASDFISKIANTTLSSDVTTTWVTYGTRKLTLTGNYINMDMSADNGSWAGSFASFTDALNSYSMLGFYGSKSEGLKYAYMFGAYNAPKFKITPAGDATFSNKLTVPSLSNGTYDYTLPSATGTLALTTDNVASATQLQNTRTLWGQNFNGSANVTGNMTNVGDITPSADKQKNLGSESLQFSYVYASRLITNSGNGLRYCSTTGKHAWYNSYTTDDTTKQMELTNSALTIYKDVQGMGGVSAMGIASMAINSVSGVAFAQKVTMNGQNYEAYNGAITLPNYTATYNPSNSGSTTEALSQKGAKTMYTALVNMLPSTSTVAGWGYKKGMVYTTSTASQSSIQVATGADPTYQFITNTSQSSLILSVTTSGAAANSYGVHRYIMIYNDRSSATLVQFFDPVDNGVIGPADSVSIPANSYMEFRIIHPASNAKCMVTWSAPLKDIETM